MDNPRILVDDQLLADALVKAGADRLAAQVQSEADRALEKAGKDLTDKLGEEAGKAVGDALKGLLPGGKKKGDG
jgi:hypothetical protein